MSNEIIKQEPKEMSMAERFTNKVVGYYNDVAINVQPTEKEKILIAGYFMAMDAQMKDAGIKWAELDLETVSRKLAAKAQLGLDMQLDNHLNVFSSKSAKNGKVTTFFITGYEGERHKAYKFAITPPIGDVVELIYSTDVFVPKMKSDGDDYEWTITSPFNRGTIVGAFGYLKFEDSRLNRLIFMNYEDLMKRKPQYAKEQFWGKWEDKMLKKTMARELFKHVSVDGDKVRKFRNAIEMEEAEVLEFQKEEYREMAETNTSQGDFIDIEIEQEEE